MKLQNIILLFILSLLFSCTAETEIMHPVPSDVEASFVVSAASAHAATRAITEGGDDDNKLQEITVLLFDPASLKYVRSTRVSSLIQDTDPNKKNLWRFTAKIPRGNYKALFLANAAAVIDAGYDLVAGTVKGSGTDMKELTMTDIEDALKHSLPGKYNADPASAGYQPFMMSSGRVDIAVPATGNSELTGPIRLSRDVAKINVKFVSRAISDQLEITQIRLCNRNTASYAVPTTALWNLWSHSAGDVTAPLFTDGVARPVADTGIVTGYDNSINYNIDDPNIADDINEIPNNECVDWIFTPERSATATNNLCLLVRGNVNIGGTRYTDHWYKLAFVRKDASGTFRNVNILRNYVYTLTINAVSDPGYDSPQAAYEAMPGNLVVDLGVVNDDGLNNIVYNGQYYLAVTKSEYEFSCISELEQELKICTDYPGGWEISPAPADWPEWLKEEWLWTAGAEGPKDITAADNLWASVNVQDKKREFAFTVTAGSLSQQITVRQKPNFYIFATPGVVGIRLSDYRRLMTTRMRNNDPAWLDPSIELSIKGSSTYKGTIVDNPGALADFGGVLENEPVYSVYTMFGSTIAVLMGDKEAWENDGRRVVWTNLEYNGKTVGKWMDASTFVPANVIPNYGTDYDIVDNPAKGHGDICREVSNGAYRIPAGNPWRLADGTAPFGTDDMGGDGWWESAQSPAKFWLKGAANAPYVGVGSSALIADKNETIFLPAAGAVNSKSGINNMMGEYVQYRTLTALGPNGAYQLFAAEWSLSPRIIGDLKTGLPVRCVKIK